MNKTELITYLEEWSEEIDNRLIDSTNETVSTMLAAELEMIDHILGKVKELEWRLYKL